MRTIYFSGFVVSPIITRHDNKYHPSIIWRFFYKFSHIFKTLHKAHQQHENAKWVSTLKFLQFDGKGNPKQHIAHFVETCENAGTQGDLLVKQFVHSLKGNVFDWYTDLEPKSINSWEQLKKEFLD